MLWSNFSDWFLFQEWLSSWRSCILRCYRFETKPSLCQTDSSSSWGFPVIWLWLNLPLLVSLLSFTLALPFSCPGYLTQLLLELFCFLPPLLLLCFSLLCSGTAAGDCGTTSIPALCSSCLTSWESHRNTHLFLPPMALLNPFSCQLHFF